MLNVQNFNKKLTTKHNRKSTYTYSPLGLTDALATLPRFFTACPRVTCWLSWIKREFC